VSISAADRQTAGVLFLIAELLALPFFTGIVMLDEGALVHTADRIASGEVLYRDVATGIGPGAYYLQALLFLLFGRSLLVGRIFMILLFAASAAAIYLLSRSVAPRQVAVGAALCYAALTVNFWRYPNYSPQAIAWILLALAATIAFLRAGSRRWLAAAGGALGLAILFKQNYGAFAALGIAAGLLAAPGPLARRIRNVAITAAAACVPIVPTVGLFAAAGAADDLWHDTVILPLQLPTTLFARPFPPWTGPPGETLRRQLVEYLPFQDLAVKSMPLPYTHLGASMAIMRALFFGPPAFLLAAALIWARRRWRGAADPARPADRAVGALLIATSGLLFLGVFPRVDAHHLVIVLAPTFVVVAWAIGRGTPAVLRGAFVLVAVGFTLLGAVSQTSGVTGWTFDMSDNVYLDSPRGRVWVSKGLAEQINDLVGEVQRRVPEGEPIFVAPGLAMYYFLADRPNPTRYPLILPGALDEEEAIRELDASRVRFALIADYAFEKFTFEFVAPRVWEHVQRSFGPVAGAERSKYPFPPYLLERGAHEAAPIAEVLRAPAEGGAQPGPPSPSGERPEGTAWSGVQELMQPSLTPRPPYLVVGRGEFDEQLSDRVGWESMYLRPALVMRAPWGRRKVAVAWEVPSTPGDGFEFWCAIGPNGSPPVSELGQGAVVEAWVAEVGEVRPPVRVWMRWIDPHRVRGDRRWFREVIDLGSFVRSSRARVILVTGPAPTLDAFDSEVAWSGLRTVRLTSMPLPPEATAGAARVVALDAAATQPIIELRGDDLPLYQTAARTYAGLASAQTALAEVAALAGRDELILKARTRAARLEPETAVHHVRLGEALERAGRRADGLVELREAVAIEALEPDYRAALAAQLLRFGRLQEARDALAGAFQLRPDHVWSLTVLSAIERQEGNFLAAEDAARRALERDPANLRAHLDLAEALRGAGRADEARGVVDDAARLDLPPQERAAVARAYARMTRPEEAAAQWRRVLELAPPGALQDEARRALEALTRGATTGAPAGRG